MTGPRNRVAFAIGQRKRQAIREILASRNPLLPPLTIPEIQAELARRGLYAARNTIAYHRQRIWLIEAIKDRSDSYVSPDKDAA